jgi:hypothetical protein
MPSDQQVAANRANAQKSTGPRSKVGREISRRNSLRLGLAISIRADAAVHDDIEKLAKMLTSSDKNQILPENVRVAAEAQFELLRIRRTRAWLFETLYFGKPATSDGLEELNKELAKLERYERRAFSRRKRALRSCNSAISF